MSDLSLFLRESRHIFSVCPECGSVNRLSDLQLARKGRYMPDWLDRLEAQLIRWENRESDLEQRQSELRQAAKRKAERRELPKLLRKVSPAFTRWKIDPRDVRAIFDPVEFVVFDGMNSDRGVNRVALVRMEPRDRIVRSVERTIARSDVGWQTIRLHEDGTVAGDPDRHRGPGPKRLSRDPSSHGPTSEEHELEDFF